MKSKINMNYFNKFIKINDKYLPPYDEGYTKANQIVLAVNNIIYGWYNDGDTYDNTHFKFNCWNDLSTYANWLFKYTSASNILNKYFKCWNDAEYENILIELAETFLNEEYLEQNSRLPRIGCVYEEDGPFRYEYIEEDEE